MEFYHRAPTTIHRDIFDFCQLVFFCAFCAFLRLNCLGFLGEFSDRTSLAKSDFSFSAVGPTSEF